MRRYLIVNGDDFGLSAGVNQGIIECAEHGILTSASLMVRWPAAIEAASYAKQNRAISVGLHVDLGDVQRLIEELRLPVDLDRKLDLSVRAEYRRLWELAQHAGEGPQERG